MAHCEEMACTGADTVCKSQGQRITRLRASRKELEGELRKLRALVKEASDYLDTNRLTNIAHGSILHQKLKAETVRP